MLFDFWKRRTTAASTLPEPFAAPSDTELAGWLAHLTADDVPAGRHPYVQVGAR
ncbi:hypothetical protein ACFOY2_45710 [Nonomuraea purpurea]|uniref:Uncharacterized protein n=1 Tax=Nonomuraea purpurea TaxID=1849276 RepID=A0ABV8GNU5_9ACTN